MIELKKNKRLKFAFPDVHADASLEIEFQRTLRIPDDEKTYPLPPGLGQFPLAHVDDHATNVPSQWLQRGGVMLPMFQSEAMWLRFGCRVPRGHLEYPFAIKIATGKQCAVTGETWSDELCGEPQNYLVAPEQPWLDGFVVKKGVIRQFVAMPLGSGYSAEEQLTCKAEHGGVQIQVFPMKREVYQRHLENSKKMRRSMSAMLCYASEPDMGLGAGGQMRQEIFADPHGLDVWDLQNSSRCFVHLCNSMVWQSITGSKPPHPAPTAKSYTKAGFPWFDYFDERQTALAGSRKLDELKTVKQLGNEKQENVLPENESVTPENLIVYRTGLKSGQVREGSF